MQSDTPPTLYNLCIDVATAYRCSKTEYRSLPDHVLFDYYYKIFMDSRPLCSLWLEMSNFDVFIRMLKVKHKRTQLLRCFQGLIEHGAGIIDDIVDHYEQKCYCEKHGAAIDLGLRLATFFSEGAWYRHAHRVFNKVERLCLLRGKKDVLTLRKLLDCYYRRIYVECSYCMFKEADKTFKLANKTVEDLRELDSLPNLASLYANFSKLYGMKSQYEEAYEWSKAAMKLIDEDLPPKVIVEILRQASKSCVFKRRFAQAGLLIEQALLLSEQLYRNDEHPSYASTLMDYGFYLLHFDNIKESVKVYKNALSIRKSVFGKNNIHVGVAYEDLSYALYVNEYSSGKFYCARDNAEKALKVMEKNFPKDHHALASIKRVKALILEEIAVDMRDPLDSFVQGEFLKKSEQLHKSALQLSLAAFGERNVQTAKQYGNLGRLYQSMHRFEEAEKMHLQAIAIKEELLGKEDYEVGLSIGHLASLYNFHMKRYNDAASLYLQSISISKKLFGASYSGLEYDYRGLINVYTQLRDTSKLMHYRNVMRDWMIRRRELNNQPARTMPLPLDSIVTKFFELC